MAEADATVDAQVDSTSSAEEIAQAKAAGWVDGPDYRGDEGKPWVTAKEFLEKGERILPLVQEKAKKLERENAELRSRVEAQESASRAQQAAIDALQASADEDAKAQAEAARAELKEAMATALEAGDHQTVADLTGKMVKLENAQDAADRKTTGASGSGGKAPQMHPEVSSWMRAHQDFLANPRNAALANAIMAEKVTAKDPRIGIAGKMSELMDEVMQETLEDRAGGKRRGGDGKVESSSGGGNRGASDDKSYSDLPADAKAACDKMAPRLVGPGRVHKDISSWRKSYVTQYYKS